jgi:hypothetical protein
LNERIRELAIESKLIAPEYNGFDHTRLSISQQRFAELIVRECVSIVEGGRFLHDQAPTAIFAKECSGAIKQHFGVNNGI